MNKWLWIVGLLPWLTSCGQQNDDLLQNWFGLSKGADFSSGILPFQPVQKKLAVDKKKTIYLGFDHHLYIEGQLSDEAHEGNTPFLLQILMKDPTVFNQMFYPLEYRPQITNHHSFSNSKILRGDLYFKGIPIYNSTVVRYYSAEKLEWFNADLPSFLLADDLAINDILVSDFSYSADDLKNKLMVVYGTSLKVDKIDPIYFSLANRLIAGYQVLIRHSLDPVTHELLIDGSEFAILNDVRQAFSLDGRAMVYKENSVVTPELQSMTLPYLEPTGTRLEAPGKFFVLNCTNSASTCSPITSSNCNNYLYFDPLLSPTQCVAKAQGQKGDFSAITPDHIGFTDVMGYFAISQAYDWHMRLMSSSGLSETQRNQLKKSEGWGGERGVLGLQTYNLAVFTKALSRDSQNASTMFNGQYVPSKNPTLMNPMIIIGAGWDLLRGSPPADLRTAPFVNLGSDSNVFTHEFGHHIVYRSINSPIGEALVLHETLADFFTYAMTGNNNLGEGIVRAPYSFMRSARFRNYTLLSQIPTTSSPYVFSEFLSAVLWEIRENLGVWNSDFYIFDKIVWDAVDLLAPQENYLGFVNALLVSADAFASQNGKDGNHLKTIISNLLSNHGYNTITLAERRVDGNTGSPLNSTTQELPQTSMTNPEVKKKQGWCGSLGGRQVVSLPLIINFIGLVLLPFFVSFAISWRTKHCLLIKNWDKKTPPS